MNGTNSNTGMSHSRRMWSFRDGNVRSRIAFGQFRGGGCNSFGDLLYRAVEIGRPGFNYDVFDAELGSESLCLQTLFRVISGKELFDERTVAFANLDGGIAFIANHWSPSDVFDFQTNSFTCGDPPNHVQGLQR